MSYGSVTDLISRFEEDENINEQSDYNDSVLRHPNVYWYDRYATKKTFSTGLMNGAVLSSNASQLRTLLSPGFFNKEDPKWYISVSLVASSLFFQMCMLILSGVLANNNLMNKNKSKLLIVINNIILVLTGIVMCINIVVNVFVQIDFTSIINNNSTAKFNTPDMPDYWSSSVFPTTSTTQQIIN